MQRGLRSRGWSADGQEAGKPLTRIVRWQRAASRSATVHFKTSEASRSKTSLARLPLLSISDRDARFRPIARVRKR